MRKENWPPNSPDLNPCDFYLWNAIARMDVKNFSTREQLVKEIEKASKKVPVDEIKKAIESFNSRVRKVEEAKGNYCHKQSKHNFVFK